MADGSRYGMVGRSEPMRRIYQLIEMAAPTKCRVFISGESGTGKELIARAIHALSPAARAAVRRAQLRRHPVRADRERDVRPRARAPSRARWRDRKGKFEAATAGTLFLDEIGDMSLMTQAKLLRVLQEGVVTPVGSSERAARWTCASSAPPARTCQEEIARGAFREDLYHRINVLTIAVPPLRARREDIPELAEHFLRLASVENGVTPKRLAPRALDFLVQLPWPGNVRELRNLMERLVVLVPKDVVGHQDVMDVAARWPACVGRRATGPLPLRQARARFERQYILDRLVGERRQPRGHRAGAGHRADATSTGR